MKAFYALRVTALTLLLLLTWSCAHTNHDSIEVLKGTQPVAKGACIIGNIALHCVKGVNLSDPSYYLIMLEDGEGNVLEVFRVNVTKPDQQESVWKRTAAKKTIEGERRRHAPASSVTRNSPGVVRRSWSPRHGARRPRRTRLRALLTRSTPACPRYGDHRHCSLGRR
jgi:hypothetical protein